MAKLSVFVACHHALFPMDDYKRTFASVARSYDVTFKFADEQITSQHILLKILNYIRDHDISLFDITGWNPNVALELGIAVGLAKRYFILFNTKFDQSKEVPSDIRGIDRIQYSSNLDLETRLILLIKQELPHQPGRSDSAFDSIKTKIVETLRTSPGLNLSKLAEAVGQDKTLVQSTVRVLAQAGELRTEGQKKGTIYFTNDTDLEQDLKVRILDRLRIEPGINMSRLVGALGEDRALVQSTMRTLAQAGEVRKKGVKRGTTYFSGGTDFRTISRNRTVSRKK